MSDPTYVANANPDTNQGGSVLMYAMPPPVGFSLVNQGFYPPKNIPPQPQTQFNCQPCFPPIPFDMLSPPPVWDPSIPPPVLPTCSDPPLSPESLCVQLISSKKPALFTKKQVHSMKISKVKMLLRNFMVAIKELERQHTHLSILHKTLEEDEWKQRVQCLNKQHIAVKESMELLKCIEFDSVVKLLSKRKAKRSRLKRKREEFKEWRNAKKAEEQEEHTRINLWLEHKKENVERIRREEEVKSAADSVLSEVFQKKNEAKRALNLLTTLGKLRAARIQQRESMGEFVSKEAAETFKEIIERIRKLWLEQMKDYNIEEKGLRVMLNDDEIERTNFEKTYCRRNQKDWLDIIFGEKRSEVENCLPTDFQCLIFFRRDWDKYVCENDEGSVIPAGWVVPSAPSSQDWAKYLA